MIKEILCGNFCPSVISDVLDARMRKKFGVYCPSKAGVQRHAMIQRRLARVVQDAGKAEDADSQDEHELEVAKTNTS